MQLQLALQLCQMAHHHLQLFLCCVSPRQLCLRLHIHRSESHINVNIRGY